MKKPNLTKEQVLKKYGVRSPGEAINKQRLIDMGINHNYETMKISWTSEPEDHIYTPDFPLDNGVIVEYKGRFMKADMKKHLAIKKQHPHLDIRFVFENPYGHPEGSKKRTNADWADKNGFMWAKGLIPEEWLNE